MADMWDNIASNLSGDLHYVVTGLRQDDPTVAALESEIERAIAVAFIVGMRVYGNRHYIGREPVVGCGMFLVPQRQIGDYRVDFLLGVSVGDQPVSNLRKCVVVECDGHQWHEKTKEQAARDKQRDRFLQTQCGGVVHFTGSEIYRNAPGCLSDAIKVLEALHLKDDK
jgi:very-short-patch-repair endonuclease